MQPFLVFLVALLVASLPAPARGSGPDAGALGAVMPPYYAALLASARGDADGTLRHVLILKAQWEKVTRRGASDGPAWLADTVMGTSVAAAVGATIDTVRQRLPQDVSGAHADLETIRALMRDARTRRGERTADDAVTEYHDAMERLSSHIGVSNEIALTANDFSLIGDDIERAHSTWIAVGSFPELAKTAPGWNEVAAATKTVLDTLAKAADRHDARIAQQASHTLKERYFDLLSALSRRR